MYLHLIQCLYSKCSLETDFILGRKLGKGGFGHVYRVNSKLDGGSYALKVIQLPTK